MSRHLTYGELTINGIEDLISHLNITDKDIFIDVGSGYGKLVEIINQKFNCKSYGIEIDKEKYDISSKIIQQKKDVRLFNGDLKDFYRIIKVGTIVYSNCTAFPVEWVEWIYKNNNGIFIHNNRIFNKGTEIKLQVTWKKSYESFYITN